MITLEDLLRSGPTLDRSLAELPWTAKGRTALTRLLASDDCVGSDMATFTAIGDLDSLDAKLKSITDAMRQELAGLSSQELGAIIDQTGDGVLALTYRSMAADYLRARLG